MAGAAAAAALVTQREGPASEAINTLTRDIQWTMLGCSRSVYIYTPNKLNRCQLVIMGPNS